MSWLTDFSSSAAITLTLFRRGLGKERVTFWRSDCLVFTIIRVSRNRVNRNSIGPGGLLYRSEVALKCDRFRIVPRKRDDSVLTGFPETPCFLYRLGVYMRYACN